MKILRAVANKRTMTQFVGLCIGIIALYFSLRGTNLDTIKQALFKMNIWWTIPIIIGNFGVITIKAARWKVLFKPVKKVRLATMFEVMTIGYMANNVLPARMGEGVRVHLLGKNADVSRVTTSTSLIADWIVEGISFLILAALLIIVTDVPYWMKSGLTIFLLVTFILYTLAFVSSFRNTNNVFLKKLQKGLRPLRNPKIITTAIGISVLSWIAQGLLVYMTQLAFGIQLPVWSILIVLISVNLAIALPSAPSHLGTFEFACVLAYTYMGLDKNMALLLGVSYHLLQIVPVTLVGGILLGLLRNRPPVVRNNEGLDAPY